MPQWTVRLWTITLSQSQSHMRAPLLKMVSNMYKVFIYQQIQISCHQSKAIYDLFRMLSYACHWVFYNQQRTYFNVTLLIATINGRLVIDFTLFFFLDMFLANNRFIPHNLLLCRPSQGSVHSQVPSQVATHQTIGSQLWAGEMPDSNPGLQENSQERYHWATMPPPHCTLPTIMILL